MKKTPLIFIALALLLGGLGEDSPNIDFDRLAKVQSFMESSNGKNIGPRYEKGFEKRYGKAAIFKECAEKHGSKATASSYGEFQIMLMVAWENNFKESPEWLADPVNNRVVYDHIIKKIVKKTGSKVEDLIEIGKRYNGSKKYGERLKSLYDKE